MSFVILGLVAVFLASYLLRQTKAWWVLGVAVIAAGFVLGALLITGDSPDPGGRGFGWVARLVGFGAMGMGSLVGVSILVFTSNARTRAARAAALLADPPGELPVASVVHR